MLQYLYREYQSLRGLLSQPRALAFQVLNLGMIVFSALMLWRSLMVMTGSESPIVVVLSGSMEPAFYKGDILFLNNDPSPMEVGEIIVFKIAGKDVPIVHRIVESNVLSNGTDVYLTKGDNNPMNDRLGYLYAPHQTWLQRHEMLGRAVGALPFVGHVTILLNEYPFAKVVLVGLMGLLVLSSREG